MFEPRACKLTIDGCSVDIEPDFRIMCEYSEAISTGDGKKAAELALRFFPFGLPLGVSEKAAARAMTDFYVSGLAPKTVEKKSSAMSCPEPVFDFAEDEPYFYAAYLSEYGINLNTTELHWLDFCALFRGLPDDCRLKQIIGIRSQKLSDIKSSGEKARISRLKKIYALGKRGRKYKNAAERDRAVLSDIKRMHAEAAKRGEKS